jgi:hypothetical protein
MRGSDGRPGLAVGQAIDALGAVDHPDVRLSRGSLDRFGRLPGWMLGGEPAHGFQGSVVGLDGAAVRQAAPGRKEHNPYPNDNDRREHRRAHASERTYLHPGSSRG